MRFLRWNLQRQQKNKPVISLPAQVWRSQPIPMEIQHLQHNTFLMNPRPMENQECFDIASQNTFINMPGAFYVIIKDQQRNILPSQSNLQKGLFQRIAAQLPFCKVCTDWFHHIFYWLLNCDCFFSIKCSFNILYTLIYTKTEMCFIPWT